MASEQEEFLKDLSLEKETVLEKPLTEEPEKESEEADLKAKNRREKRLLEKNQQLREEAIASEARLQGIREAQKIGNETTTEEFLKILEPIYGTNEPERAQATELLKKAFASMKESAKKELLEVLEARETKETEAKRTEERNLDGILDTVEEDYGIGEEDQKGFLILLEKLSPKDRDGNIIEYADPDTTAEMYLERKEKSSSRAKELASRSMTRSGGSQESKLQDDAAMRFLKENNII